MESLLNFSVHVCVPDSEQSEDDLFQEKSCTEQFKGAQADDIVLKSLFVSAPIKSLIHHCWQADKNIHYLIGYVIHCCTKRKSNNNFHMCSRGKK